MRQRDTHTQSKSEQRERQREKPDSLLSQEPPTARISVSIFLLSSLLSLNFSGDCLNKGSEAHSFSFNLCDCTLLMWKGGEEPFYLIRSQSFSDLEFCISLLPHLRLP